MTTLADRPAVDSVEEPTTPQPRRAEPPKLFRRFVDQLLSEEGTGGPPSAGGAVAPDDWRTLWASANRDATPEQALGRLAFAAHRLAADRRDGIVDQTAGVADVAGPVAAAPVAAAPVAAAPGSAQPMGVHTPAPAVPTAPVSPDARGPVAPVAVPTALIDRPVPTLAPSPPSQPRQPSPPAPPPTTVPAPAPPPPPSPAAILVWEQQRVPMAPAPEAAPLSKEDIRHRRRERLANAFGWVRNVGVIIILFAAWQVWGTSIAQHQAQQSLKAQFKAHVKAPAPATPGPVQLVSASVQEPVPPEGSVVAHLQIPAIGVDQYVVEGVAEGDLAKGPGHYAGTSMPGQAGNVAIAGHRTTYGAPFYSLSKLSPGDPITLTTDSGETLDYVVTQGPTVVAPTDVGVLDYFGDNRLTLTTCNPPFSSTSRLVVVALLRESAGTTAVVAPTGSKPEPLEHRTIEAGSVQWNFGYLLPVLFVLAFMMLLGFANRRAAGYFGRTGRWLVLVPVWGAALYLLFGFLTNLLPTTL